jgi:hypothetical protein
VPRTFVLGDAFMLIFSFVASCTARPAAFWS